MIWDLGDGAKRRIWAKGDMGQEGYVGVCVVSRDQRDKAKLTSNKNQLNYIILGEEDSLLVNKIHKGYTSCCFEFALFRRRMNYLL